MEKLSVTEILENVKNEICNNYCRFQEKFSEGCENADEAWDDFTKSTATTVR